MNSFPDNFNREICMKSLDENQAKLVENTRKNFYDKINDDISNLKETVELQFNEHLWNKHKKVIVRELLDKFEYLNITTRISQSGNLSLTGYSNRDTTSTRQINKSSEIPDNITNIKINFVIDHK